MSFASRTPLLAHPRSKIPFSVFFWLNMAPAFAQEPLPERTPSKDTHQILTEVSVSANERPVYLESEATAATKVNAALRDVPQSVQVISHQLAEDQGASRLQELIHNVSGVYQGNVIVGDNFIIRGFANKEFLRDGYPDQRNSIRDMANIDAVEILKGPASVLYGRVEPGGTINYVTKRPLAKPYASAALKVDSHGLRRPSVDVSNRSADGRIGFRLNAAHEEGANFRDFSFSNRNFISGVMTWRISDSTRLRVEMESLQDRRALDRGVPALNGRPANVPVTRLLSEPSDFRKVSEQLFGYTLDHDLDAQWRIKQAVRIFRGTDDDSRTRLGAFVKPFNGNIMRDAHRRDGDETQVTAQLELIGDRIILKGMQHSLLFGVDIDRNDERKHAVTEAKGNIVSNQINIYRPVYGQFVAGPAGKRILTDSTVSTQALYAQDLVTISAQWKLLVGARFDMARSSVNDLLLSKQVAVNANALSPRVGVVWQPSTNVSLYSSVSSAFMPVANRGFNGDAFQPSKGEQIEVGIKNDWLNKRLSTSLAAFHIKKSQVIVEDPVHTSYKLQAGEITSEGVEFDLNGAIRTGWNVVANMAYTHARITQDSNAKRLGKRAANVPRKSAGIWLSHDAQQAKWAGLGAGIGSTYVGARMAEETNSIHLPAYTRWDSSVWYRKGKWRTTLRLENVFNKSYYVSGTKNHGIYPGATRTTVMIVSYQL